MRFRRLRFFALNFAFRRLVTLRFVFRGPLDNIKNMGLPQERGTLVDALRLGNLVAWQVAGGGNVEVVALDHDESKASPRRGASRASADWHGALAAFAGVFLVGCAGVTVSRVYESDVRFERCLALDWRDDVRDALRRRCWSEWLQHFASGQPRDKVDYARQQVAPSFQTNSSPNAEAQGAPVPIPTSVFAPVPMMMSTARPAPSGFVSLPAPPASVAPAPRSPCELRCDQALGECLAGCNVPVCERACTERHGRCGDRCVQQPSGAPRRPSSGASR
jgi:hypothetical protein